MAPIPASAQLTTVPTENQWLCTATPSSPVTESRATMEKVCASGSAVEKKDMVKAMNEYNAAMRSFPDNLEMQYWTAITLYNNKQAGKALPMLKKIFAKDPNWKELTRRLPKVNLLTASESELKVILSL